ncbi:ABC transporter ATP-binding protein [Pusillimonas sp.]|uniref:ABC transporter ATP-binding protein n=1 Tax=Pusillimonas sp. TaxID=3040095 RepID=UPI0029B54646|nr:ABC transporter ATP-binding protein [Pusillimonas sp.]MDX3896414.1 ABC transporter ATP-binding protein [Pusillimonas sp.]
MREILLEASGIEACYGSSQVLFGAGIDIRVGEFVTILGRNGMGKSTMVKTIMGMLKAKSGIIRLAGQDMTGKPDHHVAQAGIGLVPEGRGIFPNLNVRENLVATAAQRFPMGAPWTLERIYTLFPRLKERETNLGCNLSGGEQQMLAIGRALMTNPRLMILDEATEGLAPLIRAEIWECLKNLKQTGIALLVIDKNIAALLRLADRHFIFEKGKTVWSGTSDELRRNRQLLEEYVGV